MGRSRTVVITGGNSGIGYAAATAIVRSVNGPWHVVLPVRDAGRGQVAVEALAAGAVDAVTFTSSSTARNFAELFTADERQAWLADLTVASIGPVTASTAAEYGLATHVMPREYTIPALARAIAEHFARRGPGTRPEARASRRGQ
jgi:NAD(P)-dependent dehydrogenase (short-subunit alcohol dehydrogenase family)